MVPVICSGCYFELMYDPSADGDSIECPVCGHVCDQPDEAQIHRIADNEGKERTGFLISFICLVIFLGGAFAWVYLSSVDPSVNADDNAGMFYGPIGAAALGFLGLAIMGIKYETSRKEAYF